MSALLRWLIVGAGSAHLVTLVGLSLYRSIYPFELEWMEGGMWDQVQRVLNGRPLYAPPSIDFTSYVYNPLYYYVCALAELSVRIVMPGLAGGLFPLRLVSILATLGCLAVMYRIVRRQGGDGFTAFTTMAMFAAFYGAGGAWLDIARVDALYLLLMLGAVLALRSGPGTRAQVAGSLLLVLSYLTKQTALVVAIPLCLHALAARRGAARWILPGTTLTGVLGSGILLEAVSDDWYGLFTLRMPGRFPLVESMAVDFWTRDLLLQVPVLAGVSVYLLVDRFRRGDREEFLFWFMLLGGVTTASYAGRLHQGGYTNTLLPVFTGGALALARVLILLQVNAESARPRLVRAIQLGLLLQFGLLAYDPRAQMPTRADLDAGRRLLARMQQVEGEVWLVHHAYVPRLAGLPSHANGNSLADLVRSHAGTSEQTREMIYDTIRSGRFAAIIVDGKWFPEVLEQYYRDAGPVFPTPDGFWTKTGARVRPRSVYVRRN